LFISDMAPVGPAVAVRTRAAMTCMFVLGGPLPAGRAAPGSRTKRGLDPAAGKAGEAESAGSGWGLHRGPTWADSTGSMSPRRIRPRARRAPGGAVCKLSLGTL
jgi:hypothetical protein